ncbi:cation:proton antiporter [bacterium]|nr:cation:proton antiporter [candidate division CSSED10-310 bacterium]
MRIPLLLIIAVIAYLGAARIFKIHAVPAFFRYFLGSGFGFLLIGLAAGSLGVGLLDGDAIAGFNPLVNLGIGWVGLLYGLQFRYKDLRSFPVRFYVGLLVESLVTAGLVFAGLFGALSLAALPGVAVLPVAVLLAVGAVETSTTICALVIRDTGAVGSGTELLKLYSSLNDSVAIVLFGIMIEVFSGRGGAGFHPSVLLWTAAVPLLGCLLGLLFFIISMYPYSENELLLLVIGFVVFCGGTANYLKLSPLFLSFVAGLTIANLETKRYRLFRVLASAEKPFFLVLAIMAGAQFRPDIVLYWLIGLVYFMVRFGAKWLAGRLGAAAGDYAVKTRRSWGLAMIPQGAMLLAILMSQRLILGDHQADLIYTGALIGLVLSTLFGPSFMKSFLAAETEP